ncbi:MAG: hypothetical protein JW751_18370 [Polyangiaceae bacterium]|nr:hypothetical protein [Polyangiaceae bacterium]
MVAGRRSLRSGALLAVVAASGGLGVSCAGSEEGFSPFATLTGGVDSGFGGSALGGEFGAGGTGPVGATGTGGTPLGGAPPTGGQPTGGIPGSTGGIPGSTGGIPGNTGGIPGSTGGIPGSTGGIPGNTGGIPGNTGGIPGDTGGVQQDTGGVQHDTGGIQNTGGVAVNCTNKSPNDTPCETWATWAGNCGSQWFLENGYCMESCGECGGGSTGGAGGTGGIQNTGGNHNTGGNQNTGGSVDMPPPITSPTPGHATHYWDCCKPSCAWPDQGSAKSCDASGNVMSNRDEQSACFGGGAYQCWSMAPWAVSSTLAYGFAAFNEGACGACYQIEFTGSTSSGYDDPGSAALLGKVMIVQKINTGGIGGGQFDLLIPGGGVGDFDACSNSWGASDLGERYGGFFLQCRNQNSGNRSAAIECARSKCQQVFNGKPDLLDGCLWWTDWGNLADNPNFNYQQVNCPSAITAVSGG